MSGDGTSNPHDIFNNILDDLLTSLVQRFPDSTELSACHTIHKLACMTNVKAPHDAFAAHVMAPFGDRLVAHDHAFFMNTSYDVESGTPARTGAMVGALKSVWAGMSEEDRAGFFRYVDILVEIHNKIAGQGGN